MNVLVIVLVLILLQFESVSAKETDSSSPGKLKLLFDKKQLKALELQDKLLRSLDSVRDSSRADQDKVLDVLSDQHYRTILAPSLIGAKSISFCLTDRRGVLGQLEERVRERLSMTGLTVLEFTLGGEPKYDCLDVSVHVSPSPELARVMQNYDKEQGIDMVSRPIFHDIRLEVYQPCSIPRIPGSIVRAQTYFNSAIARNTQDIEDKIFEVVDLFVIDYLSANKAD